MAPGLGRSETTLLQANSSVATHIDNWLPGKMWLPPGKVYWTSRGMPDQSATDWTQSLKCWRTFIQGLLLWTECAVCPVWFCLWALFGKPCLNCEILLSNVSCVTACEANFGLFEVVFVLVICLFVCGKCCYCYSVLSWFFLPFQSYTYHSLAEADYMCCQKRTQTQTKT